MASIVKATVAIRRNVSDFYGFFAAGTLFVLDILGVFLNTFYRLGFEHLFVLLGWLVVFYTRAKARLQNSQKGVLRNRLELELGLLLLLLFHAGLQIAGGLDHPLYPIIFLLLSFICSFLERRYAAYFICSAVVVEGVLYFVTERQTDPRLFLGHTFFLLSFGYIGIFITHTEIGRLRRHAREELDEHKKRINDDARMFRFTTAPNERAAFDEDMLLRSSTEQVHRALHFNLVLIKRTVKLHTCILLMQDSSGAKLNIIEVVTDSKDIAEGPFVAGEGAVGGAVSRGQVINLEGLHPGYKGICYYRNPAVVRAFLAVPISENGRPYGALCADRIDDVPFSYEEEQTLGASVEHINRTLENERVFIQLEKSKREQNILYQASQSLGQALDGDAVLSAGLDAAAQIVAYDFAAITQYDPQTHCHSVRRAVGDGAKELAELSFRDNTSLTAMAVKNRHYLPYRGSFDGTQQIVYTRKANLKGMASLLILPLIVRDNAFGTIALGAKRPHAFNNSIRAALQILSNQLAVALSNAELVARLEMQASTDGLTGCWNKRAFQEELDLKLRAAERFNRKLSLVIADLDHFKVVNDTYGHAIGDVVLKELGQILRHIKRETDTVARFGGEEFCLLCEETDTGGAVQLAERIREDLTGTIFQTELGKLTVTCSLGVATYPDNAGDRVSLFAAADKALYMAKQQGRNRVCSMNT